MKPSTVFTILMLGLVACAPSATPKSVPPTPDAKATETKIAFNIFATQTASVPTATNTTENTSTSTPSLTPTITQTPTASATPTVTYTPRPSDTPRPTSTPTATPLPTATLDVSADKQTFQALDARELQKAPEKYRSQKLVFSGEVFNIQENRAGTYMQIWVDYGGRASDRIPIMINYPGSLPGLYEGDLVVAYGRGAGTSEGKNAYGGTISQPAIQAQYVDYGAAIVPAGIEKNATGNLQGKWEITYVGDFRDKTVFNYFGSLNKTAMGVWVSIQLRIKNIQPGTDYFGKTYDFAAIDQDGKLYEDDSQASSNAAWQYCGCGDDYDNIAPGQGTVIVASFDVPESTKTLTVGFKSGLSRSPLPSPRFVIRNVDQIPAWKPKK